MKLERIIRTRQSSLLFLLTLSLAVLPQMSNAENLNPEDVLPQIVSTKDMPEGYTSQGPLSKSGSTNSARLGFFGNTKAKIAVEVMRSKSTVAFFETHMGSLVKYYTDDADRVFSRNLGLGERSFHTGNESIIQPDKDSKHVSQTVKVFWQEWKISVSISHYTRFGQNTQQDFTDHEAGQLLRSLARKIYPRFLKVVREGSTDDFTADAADTELEGEKTRVEWCREERRKLIDLNPGQYDQGIIGHVIAAMGSQEIDLCTGGVQVSTEGIPIRLGDCIKTDSDGLTRIVLHDGNDSSNNEPTSIEIGTDTEMCMDEFVSSHDLEAKTIRESVVNLIKGACRVILDGWNRGSIFSVKAGGNGVVGIRGSDVVVKHDPATMQVSAYVIDGHAEVSASMTGHKQPLTARQKISVDRGILGPVQTLSQSEWNSLVSKSGLDYGDNAQVKSFNGFETNTDRPGSDIRNLFTKDAEMCQSACMDEPQCKAFTWVRPNATQRGQGICWLKNAAPKSRSHSCCTSGVIDRESVENAAGKRQADHAAADQESCTQNFPGTSPTGKNAEGRLVCECPNGVIWDKASRSCTAKTSQSLVTDQESCTQNFPGTSPTGKNAEGRLVCECPDGVIWDKVSRSCPRQADQNTENQTDNFNALPAFVTKAANTRSASPGGMEYDRASVSVFVDPMTTRWIVWNDTPDVSRKDGALAGQFLWGGSGFGTDDFIRLMVTSPDGRTASVDMDKNNAYGAHRANDPMNVIFGFAADTPDALRIDAFGPTAGKRIVFNEGGALNQLFRIPGIYTFDFSFRNQFTRDAGHSDIYVLIQQKVIERL